jgi:hypothetical protein
MRTSLTLLDDIRIASPCHASWDSMTGDHRARHCGACDKTVYDLSRMTAAQAEALIREKEGALCVRLYRREDGRVLTADCPVGLRDRLQRMRDGLSVTTLGWILGLGIAFLLSVLALIGGSTPGRPWFPGAVQGGICPPRGGRGQPVLLHQPREEADEPVLLHPPREVEE